MKFQPVLMAAGRGGRLTPLSNHTAKCLLPIGNIPMLWYPLRSLDLSGFTDVIILVLNSYQAEVRQALDKVSVPWKTPNFLYRFETVPDIEDEGTATSLMKLVDKTSKDLLVISCDLITTIPLMPLADKYRVNDASLTCLFKKHAKPEGPIPGAKAAKGPKDKSMIGMDEADSRLLFIYSEADYEGDIPLFTKILTRHPCLQISNQLEDCHLYLIKNSALKTFRNKKFTSLQSELVPSIADRQFRLCGKRESESQDPDEEESDGLCMDDVMKLSSWTDHTGDMDEPYHGAQTRCYYNTPGDHLCIRANTIADYYEANKQIAKHKEYFGITESLKLPEGLLRSQVGSDSVVGQGLAIGEKSSIKKSMMGKNCVVKEKVKITNCIIMDNVTIDEGSSLTTCIVGDRAKVEGSCNLKECIIGNDYVVKSGSALNNDVIATDLDF